jgi:hypothetical protein
MLNTSLGELVTAGRQVNVTFNFGSTSNASSLTSYSVKVTDSGPDTTSAASGILQDSVLCTGTCPGNQGPTASSTTPATTPAGAGVTVLTHNLYSFGYTAATGVFSGTSGNVVLDDQGFIFGGNILSTALNNYLVSIQIAEVNSVAGTGLALSAITVDAVPEPSTILMIVSGLTALGFSQLKRKR